MEKHVLITGGAQGIGKKITQKLIDENFCVSVFDIDSEALQELRDEIPSGHLTTFQVDISNENSVMETIQKATKICGSIYGLVNNAAIQKNKKISELSVLEWNDVIATNLTGPFICAKHAKSFLQKTNGRIINIASTRAFQSEANTEAYSASKGGIIALTHALAASFAPLIKVNSISPGWIDVSASQKKANRKQEILSTADHLQHPAGRVGKTTDIANMVLFLLQEENDFITGQNFIIDGGMTTKMIYI